MTSAPLHGLKGKLRRPFHDSGAITTSSPGMGRDTLEKRGVRRRTTLRGGVVCGGRQQRVQPLPSRECGCPPPTNHSSSPSRSSSLRVPALMKALGAPALRFSAARRTSTRSFSCENRKGRGGRDLALDGPRGGPQPR